MSWPLPNKRVFPHVCVSVCSYIAFDFHKECSRMRWHRLQLLVDAVAEKQEEYGWVCMCLCVCVCACGRTHAALMQVFPLPPPLTQRGGEGELYLNTG